MLCEWTLPTNPGGKRASAPGVCSVTALRRALSADLAEIVRSYSKILAGKVFGARLNDVERNFKKRERGGDHLYRAPR